MGQSERRSVQKRFRGLFERSSVGLLQCIDSLHSRPSLGALSIVVVQL